MSTYLTEDSSSGLLMSLIFLKSCMAVLTAPLLFYIIYGI